MLKPVGLTLGPEGLFIRVAEMDKINLAESMVFLTKEPKEVLKIMGLDRRILNAGFKDNEQCQFFSTLLGSSQNYNSC